MKHYIIVRFNSTVDDRAALCGEIGRFFSGAADIPGITGCGVFPNCVDRDNRHDLMIELEMAEDALPAWDASELHRRWKSEYGGYIAAKTIFDRK